MFAKRHILAKYCRSNSHHQKINLYNFVHNGILSILSAGWLYSTEIKTKIYEIQLLTSKTIYKHIQDTTMLYLYMKKMSELYPLQ